MFYPLLSKVTSDVDSIGMAKTKRDRNEVVFLNKFNKQKTENCLVCNLILKGMGK